MSALGGGKVNERNFQNNMLKHLVAKGWLLGTSENYNRELALYPEDLLGFVQDTQPGQWQKFRAHSPGQPNKSFLNWVASQLNKTAANGDSAMRAVCAAPAPADHREPTKAFW